jgi:N-ethylmaleimide reductase
MEVKMKLFETCNLGKLNLKNRVVMAPMTRSRAINNTPNDLMAEYYGQRAEAGLIITEGVSPSPNGLGYARIPGIYSLEQITGWRSVAKSVHEKGGAIFMQLMHTGRVSHPENMPKGAKIISSSATALSGQMWTDTLGMQNYPLAKEMSQSEIAQTIEEFAQAAQNAIEAGMDGVELHSANGYLLEQFLNPNCNHRKDEYGATHEGRMRFVLEVVEAVVRKIGADRVGIRLSPYGVFNDMGLFEGVDEFYATLATKLSKLGVVYIHVVDHSAMGAPAVSPEVKRIIRQNFKGTYILSGGYDNAQKAESDLVEGQGDLVAYGRPFIANPDLVKKLKNNLPLTACDFDTFYTADAKGYTDYK